MIVRVGDKETAIARYRDPDRREERGGPRAPAVTGVAALAVPGHRIDRSVPPDLAYDVVAAVGDVDITGGIESDPARLVELRADRRASVSRVGPSSDDRPRDDTKPPGVNRSDDVGVGTGVARVAQIDHIRCIDRDPALGTQVHRGRIVAGVGVESAAARDRLDLPAAIDPPDAGESVELAAGIQLLRAIGDIEISSFVERQTDRSIQLGGRGRATISGEAHGPESCDGDERQARRGSDSGDHQECDQTDQQEHRGCRADGSPPDPGSARN